jgi:hypothetical protein
MDAQTSVLRCTMCGAQAYPTCGCKVDYMYMSPSEVAKRALAANPNLSDRALAEQFGISESVVRTARIHAVEGGKGDDKRIGRDGKRRRQPRRGPRRRPNRKSKSAPEKKSEAAQLFLDSGLTREQVSKQTGLGEFEVQLAVEHERGRRAALEALLAGTATFPLSAKQKLAAAIRAHTKQLDREYDQRRSAEIKVHIERVIPDLQLRRSEAIKAEQRYRDFLAKQRKLATLSEWNNLMMCLHPDTRRSASDEKFDTAFRWVQTRKFALTGEK